MNDSQLGQGLTMFVLDDEKDICKYVKEFFVKRGFKVTTALTAKAAVGVVKKTKPDIALLDIRLSEKDKTGMDVLKMIKEVQPACSCLMVTYMDDEKIVRQAMEMGAADYLKKPLAFQNIETTVRRIVKDVRKGKTHG